MLRTITEKDLLVCIVLYEQSLNKITTFKSLQSAAYTSNLFLDTFIYDNSKNAQPQHIIEEVSKTCRTLHYIHDETNPGVSRAYNKAAELAQTLNKEWLVLYDQDTTIQSSYFNELLININLNSSIKLFCPVVNSSDKIISPAIFLFGRSFMKRYVKPGQKKLKYYSLINSGLAIRLDALKSVGGYDEEFKLDFSDHYFVYKFRKKFHFFFVLNNTILQQLSSYERGDDEKVYNRFFVYLKSAILFKQKTHHFMPVFWAFVRAVKLSIQYQTFSFIKNTFNLFKK